MADEDAETFEDIDYVDINQDALLEENRKHGIPLLAMAGSPQELEIRRPVFATTSGRPIDYINKERAKMWWIFGLALLDDDRREKWERYDLVSGVELATMSIKGKRADAIRDVQMAAPKPPQHRTWTDSFLGRK